MRALVAVMFLSYATVVTGPWLLLLAVEGVPRGVRPLHAAAQPSPIKPTLLALDAQAFCAAEADCGQANAIDPAEAESGQADGTARNERLQTGMDEGPPEEVDRQATPSVGRDHWALTAEALVPSIGQPPTDLVQEQAAATPTAIVEDGSPLASPAVQFWTVSVVAYLDNPAGERLARDFADLLRSRGLPAEVLPSRYHQRIRPGYLIVSSGQFAGSPDANAHTAFLRAAGFYDAYPTYVDYLPS